MSIIFCLINEHSSRQLVYFIPKPKKMHSCFLALDEYNYIFTPTCDIVITGSIQDVKEGVSVEWYHLSKIKTKLRFSYYYSFVPFLYFLFAPDIFPTSYTLALT